MIVNVGAVFKELVTWRAVIVCAGSEMLVLHVPPYLGGHSLPANHAHKSAIAAGLKSRLPQESEDSRISSRGPEPKK